MKIGRTAALAAGVLLAGGAAGGATLQLNPSNDDIADAFAWDPSVGGSAGPFKTIDPISQVEVDVVNDDADATVKDLESAASSRTFNDAVRGETDAVSVMGSAPEPSIWTWMLAGFDRLGAAIRRIAASA